MEGSDCCEVAVFHARKQRQEPGAARRARRWTATSESGARKASSLGEKMLKLSFGDKMRTWFALCPIWGDSLFSGFLCLHRVLSCRSDAFSLGSDCCEVAVFHATGQHCSRVCLGGGGRTGSGGFQKRCFEPNLSQYERLGLFCLRNSVTEPNPSLNLAP